MVKIMPIFEGNGATGSERGVLVEYSIEGIIDEMKSMKGETKSMKGELKSLKERVTTLEDVLQVRVANRQRKLHDLHKDMVDAVGKFDDPKKPFLEELLVKTKSQHEQLARDVFFSR